MVRYIILSTFALLLTLRAERASAVTLDWDTATWAPGSLMNSYDIDPAKAGNDVTFSISGDTNRLRTTIGSGIQTPAITNAFSGGMTPTQNSLHIALDLTSNAESVTVTLDFSALYAAGIYHLKFTLFDVDYANAGTSNQYQDQISAIHGTTVNGTQIAPTVTTSASNALTGTGLNQVVLGTASVNDTGAGSGDGNVTFDFNDTAVRSFTFTYGSSSAFANPTYQHVGFWDFSYSPVPEINPAWSAIVSCLAATGLVLRHRGKFSNRRLSR
jgi:hypothetical protein